MTAMNFLFKEEPSNYNFDAFTKDKKTTWSGVRNPVAQRNLRSVKKGDRVFFYHTGDEKSVVGIAKGLEQSPIHGPTVFGGNRTRRREPKERYGQQEAHG